MTTQEIERVVSSTVHVVMTDPLTKQPVGLGSGCVVEYAGRRLLLTVAHVTDVNAATCLSTDQPPVNNQTPLYSVGAMNYLDQYDVTKYEEQLKAFFDDSIPDEDKDFGQIDFSYTLLPKDLVLLQHEIDFGAFVLKPANKLVVQTTLSDTPSVDEEYCFFGRVRGLMVRGPQHVFETTEILHSGLRFKRKIGCYFEFELPTPIATNKDFKGTSGAPIMDGQGRVVALVTHGYEGSRKIFGIAFSDFRSGVDAYILTEGA